MKKIDFTRVCFKELQEQYKALKKNKAHLAPSEVIDSIQNLIDKTASISTKLFSEEEKKELQGIWNELNRLLFEEYFPIIKDIKPFMRQLNFVTKRMKEEHSLEPFLGNLSEEQRSEILFQPKMYGEEGKKENPVERVMKGLANYKEEIQAQIEVARAFFFGHVAEGLTLFYALDEDVQWHAQRLIWIATQKQISDQDLQHELIAAAILHSIEIRMGIVDE